MKGIKGILAMSLMATMTGTAAQAADAAGALSGIEGAAPKGKAAVDVVFIIDTTSSMGGLLEAAKTKAWAIANEIAKGKPTPEIRMGLVAFRDKGDTYVTQVTDLTKDLDTMYAQLLALRPEGGGDGPEHVIAALADASSKISWSMDPKTFKVAYLIGDAPAHEDYADAPKLETVVQELVKKGVVVNAVQCGSGGQAQEQFTRVARLGEGRYAALAHDGGVAASGTPFDARLTALSAKLDGTTLAFGARRERTAAALASVRGMLAMAPASAAAERAAFKAGAGGAGFDAEADLLAAVEAKRVDLAKVKDEDLPADLRGKSAGERRARLERTRNEREALKAEIAQVTKEREAWRKKNAVVDKDAFDVNLVETLKAQAARKGISY